MFVQVQHTPFIWNTPFSTEKYGNVRKRPDIIVKVRKNLFFAIFMFFNNKFIIQWNSIICNASLFFEKPPISTESLKMFRNLFKNKMKP